MLQNEAEASANYDRFVERVKEHGEVWGLELPGSGWARCASNKEEGKWVLVFWSDRACAAHHQKDQWAAYVPISITIDKFIDVWLKSMHNDGVLAGPNWDAHLCGREVAALELAKRLTEI
jgi:Protein of unknown function (DUF2750)